MAAYVIADVTATDPQGFEEYSQMVPATVAKYGGKFDVRGGQRGKKVSDWGSKRLVILEFYSVECAKQWLASED